MRLAHVLVCHSYDPRPLFESIPEVPGAFWYIFMHNRHSVVEQTVINYAFARQARVYFLGYNRGLARSWNDGIADALKDDCEAVLLLNDDMFFYENGYLEFIRVIEIVSQASDISYVTADGDEVSGPFAGQTIAQNFACCALTRQCIEKVGFFDENFYPAYYEDIDYFVRASRLGFHPHHERRTFIAHNRGSTAALFSDADRSDFERNKGACTAYFAKKWGSENAEFPCPFNDARFRMEIPFKHRRAPYGAGYDRGDIPNVG